MKTLFIDNADLFEYSNMSKNIDPTWITNFIYEAQLNFIKPILGFALYDELITQIDTNTLTPDNILLLDEIKRPQIFAALQEALPLLWARIENGGITINEQDTQKSVTFDEMNSLKDYFKTKYDTAKQQLITFLNYYHTNYPLYNYSTVCKINRNEIKGWMFNTNRKKIK